MKIKELLFRWAHLDVARTNDKAQTYYVRCADEIGHKNLVTMRYLSAFMVALSIFVVFVAAFLSAPAPLRMLYIAIMLLELAAFWLTTSLLQKQHTARFCNLLSGFYLLHILALGALIGTVFSPDETAAAFLVTLILSQLIFILPPVVTTALAALATVATLLVSYQIKTEFFFRIDLLDCTAVFLLSILLGWMVNKMRAEEAFARSQVQQLNQELQQLSTTDQLTGLPNHRSFQETYPLRFESARQGRSALGIIMLDIDQFKAYNDNYGHVEGDKCLVAIGQALQKYQSEELHICRFGGEEFLVMIAASACGRAEVIAENLRREVQDLDIEHAFSRVAGVVTISAGLYVGMPGEGDLLMSFVDKADRAMYRSKADGGNRLTLYNDLFDADADDGGAQVLYAKLGGNGLRAAARRRILIVDDNELNRQLMRKILSPDYIVLEAENGRVALDLLNHNYESISAVLLDIVMPVLDGYEVLRQMRGDAYLARIPVIVTTGNSNADAEVKALALGANDFLVKPYNPAVIKHRLDNTINLRETAALVNAIERDNLTGLYSKEFFYKKAEMMIRANMDIPYDVICCNIERFKLVNELFGEETGDALLQYVAGLITRELKESGICGRIGADKFACLIPHRETYEQDDFAAALRRVNNFAIPILIRIRCGICAVDDPAVSVNILCDRALTAGDSIKGKYGVYFAYYDDSFRQKTMYEQVILDSMRAGVAENQFCVYYQPKYDLRTEKIAGAEALVRWNHPERGFMLPGDFIPLFEKNGFITDLDRYVWETVCRDIRQWLDAGQEPPPLSVNVSRADIYNPALVDILTGLLEKYGLEPRLLHLEITETAYTEDSAQLIEVVTELKRRGFAIEMDDFGTGYSSLNMLALLPISVLKLDMGFVQVAADGEGRDSILESVLRLAEKLKLSVVAEGVETAQQALELRDMGCGYAQGYYYARPMPKADFEDRLFRTSSEVKESERDD